MQFIVRFSDVAEAATIDFDKVRALVETNSLLTHELVEKTRLIESKDQKHINLFKSFYKEKLAYEKLKEQLKEKELEIGTLKKKIQELNEKNFCNDLIQFEGNERKNTPLTTMRNLSEII